jgi:hypothetical protein
VAEYDSAIPPGGQGKVVVKVRTRGIQGRRSKSIRLDTNDRDHRHVRLRVAFDSVMPIEVYPHPRAILHGFVGEDVTETLVVRRRDGEPLMLEPPAQEPQGFRVALEKVDEANADPPGTRYGAEPGDWRIRLSFDGAERPLAQAARLRLKTNHPKRPVLNLPVTLRVRPALIVRPQRVVLTATARDEGQPRRVVTLRHGARAPYRLTGVSLRGELPGVTATRRRDVRAAVQQIDVVLDASELKPGIHRGHLVVQTDLAARPTVEIPVRVTVRAPAKAARGELPPGTSP